MKTETNSSSNPAPNYSTDARPADGVQPWSRGESYPWSSYSVCSVHLTRCTEREGLVHPDGRRVEISLLVDRDEPEATRARRAKACESALALARLWDVPGGSLARSTSGKLLTGRVL